MNALNLAIEHAGGVGKLASRLGIRQSTVSNWKGRKQVPADRCRDIEKATGCLVTRYDLRPDIFGETPMSDEAA